MKIKCNCEWCGEEFLSTKKAEKTKKTRGWESLCADCVVVRTKKKDNEREKNKRLKGQKICYIPCKHCGQSVEVKEYKLKHHKRHGGKTCDECRSKISSNTIKKWKNKLTPEELSANAKYARSKADVSKGVTKQWENFRKDPKKYKQICEAKSKRMKRVWKEQFTEEQKNKIISALAKSHGQSRSGISGKLKTAMIEADLYDDFRSEEVFHGFIPDEINHDLKIIVELFGDLYHCNPRKFRSPDHFVKAIQRTVGEQWQRDRRRLACFYKHGYTVVIVWEKDFRNNADKQIERIKNEIEKKKKTQ